MTIDREPDVPRAALRPTGTRGRRTRESGPSFLFWLVVVLVVLACVQAAFLLPGVLSSPNAGGESALDEHAFTLGVRVLVAENGGDILVKTPLDLAGADGLDRAVLDASLFPGGDRHHYYLLYALSKKGEARVLDLGGEPLVLLDESGREFRPVDLSAALSERGGELPAYLEFSLRSLIPREDRLVVPAGGRGKVLLAFPEDAAPERIEAGRLGSLELLPREIEKDDLDSRLSRVGALLRAER